MREMSLQGVEARVECLARAATGVTADALRA